MNRNTEAVNLKITPELKAAIDQYATDHAQTLAAAVRVLLAAGLNAQKTPAASIVSRNRG